MDQDIGNEILFWNCSHGVVPKIDIIKHYLSQFKPLLLFVSEAEIKKDRNYDCVNVDGYSIEFSKTIDFGMARTLVYVNNTSKFKRVPQLEDGVSEMIVMASDKVRVCGIYPTFQNDKWLLQDSSIGQTSKQSPARGERSR